METATISPLERAARALEETVDWDGGAVLNPLETVRAVLQALREPDGAMVEAAWDVMPDEIVGGPAQGSPATIFAAMIDKALEE